MVFSVKFKLTSLFSPDFLHWSGWEFAALLEVSLEHWWNHKASSLLPLVQQLSLRTWQVYREMKEDCYQSWDHPCMSHNILQCLPSHIQMSFSVLVLIQAGSEDHESDELSSVWDISWSACSLHSNEVEWFSQRSILSFHNGHYFFVEKTCEDCWEEIYSYSWASFRLSLLWTLSKMNYWHAAHSWDDIGREAHNNMMNWGRETTAHQGEKILTYEIHCLHNSFTNHITYRLYESKRTFIRFLLSFSDFNSLKSFLSISTRRTIPIIEAMT